MKRVFDIRTPSSTPNRDRPQGQALVEFALVLPVMLLLLLLAVDFGRLFFTYVAVNNAAREATFYAVSHAGDSDFDQAIFDGAVAQAGLSEANVQSQGDEGTVSISAPECFVPSTGSPVACDTAAQFAGGIGNYVKVSATQPFDFLTPFVGEIFGGQLTLSASATGPLLNPLDTSVLPGEGNPPSPEPSESVSPDPSESPSPSPSAPPTCNVPNFKNTFWNNPDALHTWHSVAGFTGTLTNLTEPNEKIKSQSLVKNSIVPCTSNMTVDD